MFAKLKPSTIFWERNPKLALETYLRVLSIELPFKQNQKSQSRYIRFGPTMPQTDL